MLTLLNNAKTHNKKSFAFIAIIGVSVSMFLSPTANAAVGGGGQLTIATDIEPLNLNPGEVATNFSSVGVFGNVFETLVGRGRDNSLTPRLALSWVKKSPTNWQFTLRQGVVFHDGTPFNADAAAKALKYVYNSTISGTSSFVGAAATFKALDPYTLEVITETPDPILPSRLTQMPIAAPDSIANLKTISENPIGTGPYEFVSWTHGQNIKLKLFTKSYLASAGMFDSVVWIFRAEPSVRAQMIQTGEADITNNLSKSLCVTATGKGGRCITANNTNWNYLNIDNYNQPVLGDIRVRQAIAYAIDRTALVKAFYNNGKVLNNGGPAGTFGEKVGNVEYRYSPTKAKNLLKAAEKAGVNVKLQINVKYWPGLYPNVGLVAQAITTYLTNVGFNVKITSLDQATFLAETRTNLPPNKSYKDIPVNRANLVLNSTGNELFDLSLTGKFVIACAAKKSTTCDAKLDAAYKESLPLEGTERLEALQKMWNRANEILAVLPIAQESVNYALSKRVRVTPQVNFIIPLWEAKKR